jgi:hypothetical protein
MVLSQICGGPVMETRAFVTVALADADRAISDARVIGQAATLIYALFHASWPYIESGNYAKAKAVVDEAVALADEKGALFWRAFGMVYQGRLLAMTGESRVHTITSGLNAYRSTGAMFLVPIFLSDWALASPRSDVTPSARSSAMTGAKSAARACARASKPCQCLFVRSRP